MWTGRSARWGWGRDSGRDSVVGQGADRGGDGGWLVWVWPVGVVMVTWPGRSGSGWWRQPSASLTWLQAAHRPWPLGRVVGPPAVRPVTWSMCRIGASHQGVRQVWSRAGDEGAGGVGELPAFAVAVGGVAGDRVGVQAADPGAGAGVGVGDEAAGQRGGDGAVADEVGGFRVAVEQGAVGHHQ